MKSVKIAVADRGLRFARAPIARQARRIAVNSAVLAGLLLSFNAPAIAGPVEDEAALVEAVRQYAVTFAQLRLQRKIAFNGNPLALFNQDIQQRLATLIAQIQVPELDPRLQAERIARIQNESDAAYRESYSKYRSFQALSTVAYKIAFIGGMLTALNSHNLWVTASAFPIFFSGLYFSRAFHRFVDRNETRIGADLAARRLAEVRTKLFDVFFGQLDELGVAYPRGTGREEWLFSEMDGNPMTDWESLSRSEKLAWTLSYHEYLVNLADSLPPELAEVAGQIREQAARLSDSAREVRFWKSASYRALSQSVAKAFAAIARLDADHHFTANPQILGYLSADRRTLIDHEDLFDSPSREYLLTTGLPLPDQLMARLPMIRKLGGQLQLAASPEITAPGQGRVNFRLTVRLGGEARDLDFAVETPTRATDPQLLPLEIARTRALSFQAEMTNALDRDDFVGMLRTKHAEAFPREACASALSWPGALAEVAETVGSAR